MTALMLAARADQADTVSLLLEAGASPALAAKVEQRHLYKVFAV